MNRLDELHALLSENVAKVSELLKKEKEVEEKKKCKPLWILAGIGIVAAVAAAAYGLYRFFAPDYLEDFEDDFDDDFDDDFFEDEEEKADEASAEEKTDEASAEEKAEETSADEVVTDEMTEEE